MHPTHWLSLWRTEPVYEVIHDNKHEHYQYHHVAHDLSVGLPTPKHHIDPSQCVAQESTRAVKIISDPVKQPVMVLGLSLDVHCQGLEEGGLLGEPLLVISGLRVHGFLGQVGPSTASARHSYFLESLIVFKSRCSKDFTLLSLSQFISTPPTLKVTVFSFFWDGVLLMWWNCHIIADKTDLTRQRWRLCYFASCSGRGSGEVADPFERDEQGARQTKYKCLNLLVSVNIRRIIQSKHDQHWS